MRDALRNALFNRHRYKSHHEAVIIACFFNPQKSPYRLLTFQKWYHSIKHLNHRILECIIGDDTRSQLPQSPFITQIHTESLLWHKETLLNKIIATLPDTYHYIFWLDTDVLFTNRSWLTDGVEALQTASIIQPFEFCVHLERHQLTPLFDVEASRKTATHPTKRHPSLWRSFTAQCVTHPQAAQDTNYDRHGHVGFAWGARREVLDRIPLYDRALIGGADHLMAHAAAGHIHHPCVRVAFPDQLPFIDVWSRQFFAVVQGKIGYVPGDLYHLWHGDLAKRQYFQRIRDFESQTTDIYRDHQGLWVKPGAHGSMRDYYQQREAFSVQDYEGFESGFAADMGYEVTDIPQRFGVWSSDSGAGENLTDVPPASDSGGGGDINALMSTSDAGGGGDINDQALFNGQSEPPTYSDSGGGGDLTRNFS